MSALETSALDCQFIYAIARNEGRVAGIALATVWRIPLLGRVAARVMTTGSPVNTGSPLMLAPGVDVARTLLRSMESKASDLGVRLFVGRDLPAADFAGLPQLEKLYACAYLELAWPNFEYYLACLEKRKSIRRDMRAVEKAGYALEIREGERLTGHEAARLRQLWLQLYHKHQSPDQILLTEAFFSRMSELGHAVWLLLKKDGVVHAFDLCFALGDTLESTCCGIDSAATGRLPVHRVMGYEIIRYALGKGFSTINFGISNERGKVEAGCRMKAHYAWIEAYPKWLGALLRPVLLKVILQEGKAEASIRDPGGAA
ncbi:hypothetical protein OR16_24780 [Cupriavidus basilensis OR16]|uniref:BioF2-like acetyltransferase domain-containing protein n=2 Tax=Cupriavidus basilensis TaxID=68895 RepID=H1SA37_9BURK|nr:hypothetical protein OR16_24780 [Cupriavidus basilensis OR16]